MSLAQWFQLSVDLYLQGLQLDGFIRRVFALKWYSLELVCKKLSAGLWEPCDETW